MPHYDRLTTAEMRETFADEITNLGGTVTDVFDDGQRLFARSVLSRTRELLPNDRVRDGVALRAAEGDVWVHPYVLRQVCTNGAILATTLHTCRIAAIDDLDPEQAALAIREAVRVCSVEESFQALPTRGRTASEQKAEWALSLLPHLTRFAHGRVARQLLETILGRFRADGDSSQFGLINAVTSVARDTSDPHTRWRLEELGGGLLAGLPPRPSHDGGRAKRQRTRSALLVD